MAIGNIISRTRRFVDNLNRGSVEPSESTSNRESSTSNNASRAGGEETQVASRVPTTQTANDVKAIVNANERMIQAARLPSLNQSSGSTPSQRSAQRNLENNGQYTAAPESATAATVGLGHSGPAVRSLQEGLVADGYEIGSFGENGDGVDGYYGEVTQAAVRQRNTDRTANLRDVRRNGGIGIGADGRVEVHGHGNTDLRMSTIEEDGQTFYEFQMHKLDGQGDLSERGEPVRYRADEVTGVQVYGADTVHNGWENRDGTNQRGIDGAFINGAERNNAFEAGDTISNFADRVTVRTNDNSLGNYVHNQGDDNVISTTGRSFDQVFSQGEGNYVTQGANDRLVGLGDDNRYVSGARPGGLASRAAIVGDNNLVLANEGAAGQADIIGDNNRVAYDPLLDQGTVLNRDQAELLGHNVSELQDRLTHEAPRRRRYQVGSNPSSDGGWNHTRTDSPRRDQVESTDDNRRDDGGLDFGQTVAAAAKGLHQAGRNTAVFGSVLRGRAMNNMRNSRALGSAADQTSQAFRNADALTNGSRRLAQVARPVAVALDVIDVGHGLIKDAQDFAEFGGTDAENTREAAGRVGGGIAGAWAGAQVGAFAGAFTGPAAPVAVPVLGFVGGVAGGIFGAMGGEAILGVDLDGRSA